MSTSTLKTISPIDGSIYVERPLATSNEIDQALAMARSAQRDWQSINLNERAAICERAVQYFENHRQQIAEEISRQMGRPIAFAAGEISGLAERARHMISIAPQALQDIVPEATPSFKRYIRHQPLGVVFTVAPWNYPLLTTVNSVFPAIMAGNSVILKPSEETPLVADLLVKILNETLPEGVLQIAHGGGDVGEALVKSNINMIAFTGSLQTGRNIMANAAPQLKRLVMELGGNDPMIVLEDADIFAAAQFAVASSFENAGQMCTSTERVYVDAKIADQFEQAVVSIASQYKVGSWRDSRVNIGPLVNKKQHAKVVSHIEDALEKGAHLLFGDKKPLAPFIQPTVISNINPSMKIESEETFGPVVAIDRFAAVDDAIARANDSIYGLGAVVFGKADAKKVAQQLQAGMIGINQGVGAGGDAPWVGAKQSGFGFHGSADGHRQFAQVTVINH